jgi:Heparinase II/III-like protein/Heparinase II/III N-terminus
MSSQVNHAFLRKVIRATPGEMLFRADAFVNRWIEEGCFSLGLNRLLGLSEIKTGSGVFDSASMKPAADESTVSEMRLKYPAYVQEIQRIADMACEREFILLGVPVRYRNKISWCSDPISGKKWPMSFHRRINIFAGDTGAGDVKYVWELNRHQFLITLAKAYRLTGDERYVRVAVELLEDWIEANPYNAGVNWTSGLEVAIRSLSWCQVYTLFESATAFGLATRRSVLRSLYEHGHYIEKHLSFFFSPYNHLIGEATALYVLGHLLSSLKAARRWRERGWAILQKEKPSQFHPDGGTVEQAAGYHHFTLGFYLQAILLRRRLGEAVPGDMWSLLEKAFEFSMHMTRPDGLVPMIGDGDEGKAIDLLQSSIWDFRPFLAIAAVLFERGDFKAIAGPFPPDATWLLGRVGWERYEALREAKPAENSRMLPESGYCIMRTGWDHQSHYLNFDCGEIAAGVSSEDIPSAAHGHADALSIEVSAHGVPILVDPGFYTYNGAEKWHRYFRETKAHNTVVVDDCSQADYRGRLKWSRAPEVHLEHCMLSSDFDYIEASHNGYRRLAQPVVHRRAVIFVKPDYWLIRDELWGEGEHQIDRYFHFAAAEVIRQRDGTAIHAKSGRGGNLAVISVEKEGIAVEAKLGGTEPEDGWLAMGYGRKVHAPVVRCSTKATLPIALHTLLLPFRDDVPTVKIDAIQVPGGNAGSEQGFVMEIGGQKDILFFSSRNQDNTIEFHSNGWLTNGRLSCLRLDTNGKILSCALVAGSLLVGAGSVLLQAVHKVPFAALSFRNSRAVIEKADSAEVLTSL